MPQNLADMVEPDPSVETPFRVLAICTGNLFRSPAAEFLLREALPAGIAVVSAGTRARPGMPVDPEMAVLLERVGLDTRGFRSRPLTGEDVRAADLVLGLTRAHRGAAVTLVPAALRRSYTLKEFARLVTTVPTDSIGTQSNPADPAARLAALTREAVHHRGPVRPEDEDIIDPVGQGQAVTRAVFSEIRKAVDTIARVARGA